MHILELLQPWQIVVVVCLFGALSVLAFLILTLEIERREK